MNVTNNTTAVNLLDSPAGSGQDSSSTTNRVIGVEVDNLSAPIDPERAVVLDKPLAERSAEEEQSNPGQSKPLVKFNSACVIEESGKPLSSLSSRQESPVQAESMLDERVGIQRASIEITLDDKTLLSINKAVENKNQKELDRLLQQHSVHGDTILTNRTLIRALETAIYHDENMAISLINAGVGVKYEDERRSTSGLAFAFSCSKHAAAEALLKKGANPDGCSYDTQKPLLCTIKEKDLNGFELLLKYEPTLEFSFLKVALDELINIESKKNKAPARGVSVADHERNVANNDRDAINLLEMAKVLINAGVNVKIAKGNTLIRFNVKGNKLIDAPPVLEEYGVGGRRNNKDYGGESVIYKAVNLNNFGLLELLLNKGNDVNAWMRKKTNSCNPLCHATFAKKQDLIDLLLTYGADVNAFFSDPNDEGFVITPVQIAIMAENPDMDIIKFLINNHAIVHQSVLSDYKKLLTNKKMDDLRYPPPPLLTLKSMCLRKTLIYCGDVSDNNNLNKKSTLNVVKHLSKIKSNVKSLQLSHYFENDLLIGIGRILNCTSFNVLAHKQDEEGR
ncbi:MAG: hypothetical protein KAG53_06050 [Endozoicomonadaceae bacterium]|nr:hypothetical protein [Endozoicomonadaceae bacterium]